MPVTFGFPRMREEAGERRDFLPDLVRDLVESGAHVCVESGIGSGMGYADADYASISPAVHVAGDEEAYAQDVVVVLRSPKEERFELLRRGATLVSMLHFPTRLGRVACLRRLGLEAISMDCVTDDGGRRLVENLRSVAWNGLEASFDALATTDRRLAERSRPPVRVLILGAGGIGKHAVEAATKYGNPERNEEYMHAGLAGVEATAVGRNVTSRADVLADLLARADVLVDATQRNDTSKAVVGNALLARLPEHAVICDLCVDPYLLDADPPTVRGIEGIPQGNLDQHVFAPDDPAWERTVPPETPTTNRRTTVSCYSWPGVHAETCMEHYGLQLAPLLKTLLARDGVEGLRHDGPFAERALARASLRNW